LLISRQHDVNGTKVARGAEHLALGTFVSCEYPKAIGPEVVNNVMNVAYASCCKRVGNLPCAAAVSRNVDVNFRTLAIVEIFAPVDFA
jgi:hypothetical protein